METKPTLRQLALLCVGFAGLILVSIMLIEFTGGVFGGVFTEPAEPVQVHITQDWPADPLLIRLEAEGLALPTG